MLPAELHDAATFDFEELFTEAYIRFIRANGTAVGIMLRNNTKHLIRAYRHRTFGKCYTLHLRKEERKFGIYNIKFTL